MEDLSLARACVVEILRDPIIAMKLTDKNNTSGIRISEKKILEMAEAKKYYKGLVYMFLACYMILRIPVKFYLRAKRVST